MNIAIAGFGVEGKSSYDYWNTPDNDVVVVDEKLTSYDLPYGVAAILDNNAFSDLNDFDLVIRSPSINPRRIKTSGKVWSATNEFFAKCPAPIIGVTGTKGKGTTSSLIASILQAGGKKVHLIGNIGVPALSILKDITPNDVVVFELSSFQLWDICKSPELAVVLAVESDHLDVHDNFKDYINAKANIRRFQDLDDNCIYHPTNKYAKQIAETSDWPQDKHEKKQWQEQATRYAVPEDEQVYAEAGFFMADGQKICSVQALQLPGAHNIENACAAISAACHFVVDIQAIEAGLRNFTGLPHRLRFVRELNSVKYYDDSIATSPGSAIAALRSFNEPKVLIVGGSDKGADYNELITMCRDTDTTVIAIGQIRDKITKLCNKKKVHVISVDGSMKEIVKSAAKAAGRDGSVVILSPAAASFDMFKSYTDRGEQFVTAVNMLEI